MFKFADSNSSKSVQQPNREIKWQSLDDKKDRRRKL